ncbi:uncharacterized protein Z518_01785 [Rhinocladiella mackenziei CBS 650.93]|uniref:Protein kinase domain-containing protein n=1 Tax=Rhinocladiella mackenziei CBS 650.93 TaxID=1442369 RepID=A0A0D2J4Q4_9EURO|nr:uncharacterized protein Z518_01785 [Rhinocladiella mackenziei CBS 650.93]KIX10701.1 hypothetical protein Z518_01785 [Rhinocladiella mackenziei CBS 650.93]
MSKTNSTIGSGAKAKATFKLPPDKHILKQKLINGYTMSQIDEKPFVSESCLDAHLNTENIKAEMRAEQLNINPDLVEFIYQKAKKLFAILVYSRMTKAIKGFHEHQLTDDYLPLHYEKDGEVYELYSLSENLPPDDSSGNALNVFGIGNSDDTWKWDDSRIHDFCTNQWQFVVPVFVKTRHRYIFHEKSILPFEFIGERKHGGFSSVYPAHISNSTVDSQCLDLDIKAHLEQVNNQQPLIAVKEPNNDCLYVSKMNLEKMYQEEADVLEMIRELSPKDPHLVDVIAVFQRGDKLYFMFPWANGGNLRNVWQRESPGAPDVSWAQWVLDQLLGLSKAIWRLHNLDENKNCRHGDLKPENILCFLESDAGNKGRLVIADVGLAKIHENPTWQRIDQHILTVTVSGTQKYEPPDLLDEGARSRAYDIWSMGCICLEFIIWLLYGKTGLETFGNSFLHQKFWTAPANAVSSSQARVHDVVFHWMMWMRKSDPRVAKGTAFGDLLELVQDRLLVVKVNRTGSNVQLREYRALSDEFYHTMVKIRERATSDSPYLKNCIVAQPHLSGPPSTMQEKGPSPRFGTQHLPVLGKEQAQLVANLDRPPGGQVLTDTWETVASNDFAVNVFRRINWQETLPPQGELSKLCNVCEELNIWREGISIEDLVTNFEQRASFCGLCGIFYRCAEKWGMLGQRTIQFHRLGSAFHLDRHGPPVLTICTNPTSRNLPRYVQVGFPKLPSPGGSTQIELIREWLRLCDEAKQHDCHPTLNGPLPTRVLDVGSGDNPGMLRLYCPAFRETGRYLALSHRWGDPAEHRRFCTIRANHHDFERSIGFDQLPKTFQDAVIVTRGLGVRFLWIDSLCIVQDDPEDWESQSKLMEDVFSFAYCTIAAGCARGTTDGFLKPRPQREFVTLKHNSGDVYYVCKAIDNFRADVEEGELNQRGWVLQERALSHRTIHFTESQVYWECGGGVHCETLTKMRNPKSAFLGDSEFPKSAERFVKGGRIRLYEFVYQRYSTLAFTNMTDRSIALSGLEKRLVRTFNTNGVYGIFEAYLNRSLLWQRAGDEMRRISYPKGRKVPSWSWMAYDGCISYVDVPFGKVDWLRSLQSPFRQDERSSTDNGDDNKKASPFELTAFSRDFSAPSTRHGMHFVVFDQPGTEQLPGLKYVVLGKDKSSSLGTAQKSYILVVAPALSYGDPSAYERVGAGFVEKHQIDLDGAVSQIRIW